MLLACVVLFLCATMARVATEPSISSYDDVLVLEGDTDIVFSVGGVSINHTTLVDMKARVDAQDKSLTDLETLAAKLLDALSPATPPTADLLYDLGMIQENTAVLQTLALNFNASFKALNDRASGLDSRASGVEGRATALENSEIVLEGKLNDVKATAGKLVTALSNKNPASEDSLYDLSVIPQHTSSISSLTSSAGTNLNNLNAVIDALSPAVPPSVSSMYSFDKFNTDLTSVLSQVSSQGTAINTINTKLSLYDDMYSSQANLVMQSDFVDAYLNWTVPPKNTSIVNVPWLNGVLISAALVVEENHSGCYGVESISNVFDIDPRNNYEIGMWIRSEDATIANNIGFFLYYANGTQIQGKYANPYCKIENADYNTWNYFNCYLLSSKTPVNGTVPSVDFLPSTTGLDWVLPAEARKAAVRFGSCSGNGVGNNNVYFAFPSCTQVSASTALEMAKALDDQLHDNGANLVKDSDFIVTEDSWAVPLDPTSVVPTLWYDGRTIRAFKSVETSSTGCRPFGVTNKFPVDIKSSYEFGIWLKSDDPAIYNYLGFYIYDASGKQIGDIYSNPYFKSSGGDTNSWHYISGALLPPNSGADSSGRLPFSSTTYADYAMHPNTAFAQLRFGSCYGGGATGNVSFFAFPSVRRLLPSRVEAEMNQITTQNNVNYIGRYNVPISYTGSVGPGTWARINLQTAVGFDFSDYMQYVREGQVLQARMCAAYSDSGTTGQVLLRLMRISGANDAPYPSNYVFWQEGYGSTWSGSGLIHHNCGSWIPVANISCGYSWSNTCEFDVSHTQSVSVTMKELDIELGILSTLR